MEIFDERGSLSTGGERVAVETWGEGDVFDLEFADVVDVEELG